MSKYHSFNRPLFTDNRFFKQSTFSNNRPFDTNNHAATPATLADKSQTSHQIARTGNKSNHKGSPSPSNNGSNKAKQGIYEPTRFNMNHKPDPASFYAHYGITLKGKQTNVRCCFHDDKTPSLSINRHTGAFYCFGCGASGGDVIDFYQRYHGCDFITACKALNIDEY